MRTRDEKVLFATAAALAFGGIAHASDMTCHLTDQRGDTLDYKFRWAAGDPAIQELGFMRNGQYANYNHTPLWHGFDNPDSSTITSDEAPGWFITYATTPGNGQAALWHSRNIVAQGECYKVPTVAAAPAYNLVPAIPAYDPLPATGPAPAANTGDDSVPITSDEYGTHLSLMVGLGSDQFQMMIDTGADLLQITDSVSDGLVARGEATPVWTADGRVKMQGMTMADGHSTGLRRLTIHTVTIGSHVLHDVPAIAANDDRGGMLLAGSVLARIGKFSIDAANGKLSFGGTAKAQEDHPGMYYARAEMAGMLARASGQCPAKSYDTKAMMIASAKLLVSIIYVVDPPSDAQRRSWGEDGAGRFNAEAAADSLGVACDTAMRLVEKAREAID
jgi:predicted aspartyl protease